MKIAHEYVRDQGVSVQHHSSFFKAIENTVKENKCTKLIETGTHRGEGTTSAIIEGMDHKNAVLYTIEANKDHWSAALRHVKGYNRKVVCMYGLSIPYSLLPTEADISNLIEEHRSLDVFIDHGEENRLNEYLKETPKGLEDDLLARAFEKHGNMPDFILLDSAGHMGFVEFKHVLSLLLMPCIIALDDTQHIKHYKSLEFIKQDSRFTILNEVKEKFGYAIARFNP